MRLRNPLIVAVVGTLLVGGAATGTTHASWVGQSNLQAASVGSGIMGIAASASAGSLTVQRGGSATVRVTVNDTSSPAAKNLKQRATPTVGGSFPSGVTASLTTASGGGCTNTPQGPVDLDPGGSFTTCVTVSASATASASSATVDVGVAGAQVPGGWTTPAQTVSVPVSVQVPVVAPTTRCGTQVGSTGHSLEWDPVAGATTYRIYQALAPEGPWPATPVALGPGLSHTATVPDTINARRYLRVTAVIAGVESSPSHVIEIRRQGNSTNFTCQDLG